MRLMASPGPTQLRLDIRRRSGFELARWLDVVVPTILDTPGSTVETGRDRLRAFLYHCLGVGVNVGQREPAVYRIVFAGETVMDRWDGRVLTGCDPGTHVIDCGLFACPYR